MTALKKCPPSFAGMAKHKVTIQEPVETGNTFGGFSTAWQDVGAYWAIVTPAGGSERTIAEQLQSMVTHTIIVRWQDDLKNTKDVGKYRLVLDGRNHAIRYVQNLDIDMKNYGKAYQKLYTEENAPELE